MNILQGGSESWGATAVVVIFGSWFGRILIETEIASTLIKKTVELSGENPLFTTALISIVTTIIFTSTFGAGSATVGTLQGMGIFPMSLLFPLIYVPTIAMNLSACPTQSWNLWALNYSKVGAKEFMKTGLPWAWAAGADIVKLFPGSAVGPSYIKAVKGPLPHANIMPTGGVSYDNLGEWIKAGAVAVGAGSNLTHPFEGATSADITETAAKFIARYRELKAELA